MFCLFPLNASGQLSLEEVVDKVQRNYEKIIDLKANFHQETYVPYLKRSVIEDGTVFFKKPGKMRWDYKHPTSKTLYLTSAKAWLYVPKERAVYVQDVKRLFDTQLPLRLLSGKANLKEDFIARFDPAGPMDKNGNYLLQLDERRSEWGVRGIGIKIDGQEFYILSLSFSDVQGNSTVISFKDLRINEGISDSVFVFQPPRGIQVYDHP
ncbi:MAG: outer membrane lipoprotein carrier protein LolA [Syntrophales bacterium]|nr:outer membrane lipoprotein carrier protein LolA [Syntrophales bacterium]